MSALSIQPTYPIFTDIDGQPLEDGYVWIGQANLDPQGNPIQVYWDAALTILAAQPIRTLAGYPANSGTPARLYVNSDYSIRVMNKNGSVVYSALAATERYSDVVVSGVNAEDVIYDPPFIGGVQTNVETKLAQTVSVKDFGAVGDGVTDDTVAIQTALSNVSALHSCVVFPAGNYLVSAPLIPQSNTVIQGQGATITTVGGTAFDFATTGGGIIKIQDAKSNIEICGLKFVCTNSANLCYGITLNSNTFATPGQYVNNIRIHDCQFIDIGNTSVYVFGGTYNVELKDLYFEQTTDANLKSGLAIRTLAVSIDWSAPTMSTPAPAIPPANISQIELPTDIRISGLRIITTGTVIYMSAVRQITVSDVIVDGALEPFVLYCGDYGPDCRDVSFSNLVVTPIQNNKGGFIFSPYSTVTQPGSGGYNANGSYEIYNVTISNVTVRGIELNNPFELTGAVRRAVFSNVVIYETSARTGVGFNLQADPNGNVPIDVQFENIHAEQMDVGFFTESDSFSVNNFTAVDCGYGLQANYALTNRRPVINNIALRSCTKGIVLNSGTPGIAFGLVQFQGNTANLDDPDGVFSFLTPITGSWLPVLQGSIIPGTQGYATQTGFYRRVGEIVEFWGYIVLNAKDAATAGNLQIKNLPFQSSSATDIPISIGYQRGIDLNVGGGYYTVAGVVNNGGSLITLYQNGDNVSSANLVAADFDATFAFQFSGFYKTNS